MDVAASNKHNIVLLSLREIEGFVTDTLRGDIVSCPPSSSYQLALNADCYRLHNTEIWGCSYHAPIDLKFSENDYFRIQLQQQGQGLTQLGNQKIAINAHQAIISHGDATLGFGEGFKQKALRINRSLLIQKLALMMDKPLIHALSFDAAINCRTPRFQAFTNLLKYIEGLAQLPDAAIPPFVLIELEQTLYSLILGSFKHNYSQFFEQSAPASAPRQVRRVEEYIRTHWDHAITIADIVAVAGCSARSIFRAFQQSRGYTPMEFVKQVRLEQAHRMLLTAKETSVTRIALSCGFTELGRFSREYAMAYGQLPSHTLKQSLLKRSF